MNSPRAAKRFVFSFLLSTFFLAFLFGIHPSITFKSLAQSASPGIKSDRGVYPEPALPTLPNAGGKFNDPVFGTEIMRATDAAECPPPGCGTYYNQWPTFNADNTRILIRRGETGDAIIKSFDPVTFTLGATVRSGNGEMGCTIAKGCSGSYSMHWEGATWDYSDPDKIWLTPIYYPPDGGMRLYTYKPSTNTFTLVKDFTGILPFANAYSQETHSNVLSNDVFTFVVNVSGALDNPSRILVWRRSTNTVLLNLATDDALLFPIVGTNAVLPSKSGRWIYFSPNGSPILDQVRTRIYDTVSNTWQQLRFNSTDDLSSHGDIGTNVLIGHGNFSGKLNSYPLTNVSTHQSLFDYRDANGLPDWSNDQHMSLYADDESWMMMSLYDESNTYETGAFENEIMQCSMSDPQVFRRLLHHRSKIDNLTDTSGYWAIPKATISLNGRFIAFTSNWGNSGRYDLFIARIDPPGSTPSPSPTPTPTSTPTPTPTPTATPTPTPTPLPPSASVTFVQLDTTTKGNWQNSYGANGHNTVNDSVSYPSYAQVSVAGYTSATWMASTTDVRALKKASASDRVAARWDSTSFMTLDLNLTDGATHRVAIYGLDWDGNNRAQRVDLVDYSTNSLLDSRSISTFNGGEYLVWDIRGHVKIIVNKTGPKSAVVSGLYFGGPVATPSPTPTPTATPTPTPTATPTPMPTPSPTPGLGHKVGHTRRGAQTLSNQLLSGNGTETTGSNATSLDQSAITATEEFVSEIQEAQADLNANRNLYPAAARIDVALQSAFDAAWQSNQAACLEDLPSLKIHLREAINYLMLSDVLITYGDVANPIDLAPYMVRQQYVDFLNREPDEPGGDFWVNQIAACGTDAQCVEIKRINVSAAFFLSIESQQTGYYVHRLYKASHGRVPALREFLPDNISIASGVIVGNNGWEARLARNKEAFLQSWVQRADFRARYDRLTNEQYVDSLILNTGVTITAAERDAIVQDLLSGASRTAVLARLIENPTFTRAEFNSAFVLMQYFGYLGRDPDSAGFNFWLNKLNQFNGNFVNAEMVKAFLVSSEYRQRFGRP